MDVPTDTSGSGAEPGAALPPVRSAGAALVRALARSLDTLERAIAEADPVEMIHDARKAMKEYRALLRLSGGKAAADERRRTAAVARQLSHSRDRAAAHAALKALDEMGLVLACDLADGSAAIGADAPPAEEAERHRSSLSAFLHEARQAAAGALGAEVAGADVGRALRQGYRQARHAGFDTAEAMHEVRKRVVTHRYQMSFVAGAFGGRGGKRARRAQALRDLFGANQDIETLRPLLHAAEPPLAEGTLERLDLAMTMAQKRLKKKAMRAHAALFRRRSHAFRAHYRDIL